MKKQKHTIYHIWCDYKTPVVAIVYPPMEGPLSIPDPAWKVIDKEEGSFAEMGELGDRPLIVYDESQARKIAASVGGFVDRKEID